MVPFVAVEYTAQSVQGSIDSGSDVFELSEIMMTPGDGTSGDGDSGLRKLANCD
jgi:hypothetical protein